MRFRHLVVLALAACGSNGSKTPDAFVQTFMDAPIDSPPDAPNFPPGCDYAEQHDALNDDYTMMGTAEPTNLMFTATAQTLCGTVDTTHYDATNKLVDIDSYAITLAQDSTVLVTLQGA